MANSNNTMLIFFLYFRRQWVKDVVREQIRRIEIPTTRSISVHTDYRCSYSKLCQLTKESRYELLKDRQIDRLREIKI